MNKINLQKDKSKIKINKKVRDIDFIDKNVSKVRRVPTSSLPIPLNFAKVRKAPCNLLKNKIEFNYLS